VTVKVIAHHTLYRSKRFFSAFPSLVTTAAGKVLLAFRRAPDHRWLLGDIAEEDFNSVDHVHFRSHVAFTALGSDLRPVGEPQILPVHAEAGDQDGNLFISKSGRLFQFSFRWYPVTMEIRDKLKEIETPMFGADYLGAGYIFHGSYVRYSDDEGHHWSNPVDLARDPLLPASQWEDIPSTASLRGRMIELENGDLLFATYTGGLDGNPYDCSRIMISHDAGESWGFSDQYFVRTEGALQEPALALWPKGKVTIFHRTTNNDDKLIIAQADAKDLKFGPLETIDVIGHPYDPLVLPDGRLFLVYGYRHKPMGVRARLVEVGQEIADADEIIIRDDSLSRDTGYPSATLLDDGRILVAYYIADNKGIRGIEASLLEIN
jgi:hypothetical protein